MPDNGTPSGPPDLLEVVKKIFKTKKSTQSPKSSQSNSEDDNGHIGRFISLAIGLIVVLWILSGIFVVRPAEQTAVLRFGKYSSTVGPGPHWIPRFIDTKYTVDVQQVRNFSSQAEMLTKDENIVSVDLAIQYRIGNIRDFLFNTVNPITTLKEATASATRQVVGQMTLDSVLTTGREALRDRVETQLKKTLVSYQTGLDITDVTLQPVKPPEAVTAAFDDAIKAREDKQSYINKANAYARKAVSIANGKIARLKQEAEAYEQQTVLQAKGSVARYLALLKPYEHAPKVTEERLYLDAITNVLSHTSNIVVENNSNILYLPLEQILNHAKKSTVTTVASTPETTKPTTPPVNNKIDYGPSSQPGYHNLGGYTE